MLIQEANEGKRECLPIRCPRRTTMDVLFILNSQAAMMAAAAQEQRGCPNVRIRATDQLRRTADGSVGMEPTVESRAQIAWLDEQGIIRARSKPGVDLTRDDAED